MPADDPLTEKEIAFQRIMADPTREGRKRWHLWCERIRARWLAKNPNRQPDKWTLARGKHRKVSGFKSSSDH